MGHKIIEGILSNKTKTFEKCFKNLKHVAQFSYIHKINDKFEVGYSKVVVNFYYY
jgi:hypothetical protein